MNKLKVFSKCLIILSVIFAINACDNSDDWKPGPEILDDNPGVFFSKETPMTIEVGASSSGELHSDFFTVALGRDETKSASAISVPIILRNVGSNMEVDKVVEFEAGSTTAELRIKITEFEFSVPYQLSLEIDERYSNPYSSILNGSSKIEAVVEVVSLVGEATFTPTNFSSNIVTTFLPFKHKIYDNMDGTYTIKNFLYNNAGHDVTFELDENGYIEVMKDIGYHEEGTGSSGRWYFYSGPSSSSSNYIPCFIPSEDPIDHIRYIYFYTAPGYSNFNFWLDLDKKEGKMTGYARYQLSSSGRVTFDITWN